MALEEELESENENEGEIYLIWDYHCDAISGVPLSVEAESFRDVAGVCEARRMKRFREVEKEDSNSVCLSFEGELLERV